MNTQKFVAFPHINNDFAEKKNHKTLQFTIATKIKYLGIN
jgi:hypothetical protein